MTSAQLNHFRQRLETLCVELLDITEKACESTKPVQLDQASVGRLSRMDAMQQKAMADATAARRRAAITRLRAALARIDAADFGECAECGDDIPMERLRIDPSLTRCAGCIRGE